MKFKALLTAAVTAGMLALSAPASATLTNWYVDTDGPGGNAAVMVSDYLDLTGNSYVNNTFTSASAFNFNEVGQFYVYSSDASTALTPHLTAKFTGSGSGTIGAGGTLNFGAGSLDVFSGLTNIANFNLQSGSANLNTNSTLPNGTVSLIFEATSMLSGYFFDAANIDLFTYVGSPTGLVMGFATTNVIDLSPAVVGAGLIADYNTAFKAAIPVGLVSNQTTDLYLSNNGQFRMEVPEPGMLSLFGIALLGMGFLSRRRKSS